MTAPVFRYDRPDLATAERVRLDGAEGRHAAQVRRLRVGEEVHLTDGAGLLAEGQVVEAGKDWLDVALGERHREPEPAPRVVVVQALPKGDRGELAVETMTEVGVDVVVPWAASRCVTVWRGERGVKALTRWRATAREAAKQARRARAPEITEAATTAQVADLLSRAALAGVLHESAATPLAGAPVPAAGDVVLVVGPEGGVSPEELAAFTAAGATPYRLGPSVLRTSTAGVVAAAVLLARSGRWG